MYLKGMIESSKELRDAFDKAFKKRKEDDPNFGKPKKPYEDPVTGALYFYNHPFFTPTKEASGITTKEASGITTKETMGLKKGGVTNAIKKIRGIGMAKGGFKKKTPIY